MKASEATQPFAEALVWHMAQQQEVFAQLGASTAGLTEAEAKTRQEQFGWNVLPHKEPPSLSEIILHQFKSPLIYILLGAAAVAVVLRDFTDAGFILAVVYLTRDWARFRNGGLNKVPPGYRNCSRSSRASAATASMAGRISVTRC